MSGYFPSVGLGPDLLFMIFLQPRLIPLPFFTNCISFSNFLAETC